MRKTFPFERLLAISALAPLIFGCQQADQVLPFELDEGQGATVMLGTNGGIISVPPSFALDFPVGSLPGATSVQVLPRITEPFPSDAGIVVPGTAFDITPVGTLLATPARVEIAIPELQQAGDAVRLSVALIRGDGSVATFIGSYDLTNGILVAEIDELGSVAAVISAGAIPVSTNLPPTLGGGSVSPPPPPPALGGPALAGESGTAFVAECAPDARQCFTSGLVRIWVDDVVEERLGEDLFLLNPTVSANIDFISFDQSGVPAEVVGSVTMDGDLRARIGRAINGKEVSATESTGPGQTPTPTAVSIVGNKMTLSETSDSTDVALEFGVTGIGTSEMITLRVEGQVLFPNDVGDDSIGWIYAHIRLRR